ncbi:hypothetical protein V493_00244 [Pseudogymnoascus sp. VKM F-4281 (FW-2241)]|nr:hypothetical protein V493_00244 [Pseudogymnoascus sp. VKM F-4281 (FW-2241)]
MDRVQRLLWKKANRNCQYCRGLQNGQLRIPAAALINGAQTGCPACHLLYQSVSPADLADQRIALVHVRLFGDSQVCHTFDPGSEDMSRKLCLEEGFSKGGWVAGPDYPTTALYPPVERAVELFSHEGRHSPWPKISTARTTAAAANTDELYSLIHGWMGHCEKEHPGCKDHRPQVLPDRVVFVGKGSDPYLVEPKGSRADYIALSHRWGGQVSLQLKTATLDDFKKGIPFSSFPKTFQDAITVCRSLLIEYIWIDSICIIQDSKDDWDVQGSKMDQVYSNCVLTIAADAAENGDSGFLETPERRELQTATRKIDCVSPSGEKGEIFVRPWRRYGSLGGFGRHYSSWEPGSLGPSQRLKQQGSFLVRRGWVLQETFLPGRIIHFLSDEVTWKCAALSRCECQLQPHAKVAHRPLDLEEPREITSRDLKEFWREVIEQYTQREFTVQSDRLAAMAGLANHVHFRHPDIEYYAGLWSDELPSTLLWVVNRGVDFGRLWGNGSNRNTPPIAPTWSWGSVTGCVAFLFWNLSYGRGKWAESKPDLTDVQMKCTPSGRNRYGSVKDAELTAEGYLCNVRVWLKGGSEWHFPFKMEAQKPDGTVGKTNGFFYPDTEEILAVLQAERKDGVEMVVVSVYESRMFIALRKTGVGDLEGPVQRTLCDGSGVLFNGDLVHGATMGLEPHLDISRETCS